MVSMDNLSVILLVLSQIHTDITATPTGTAGTPVNSNLAIQKVQRDMDPSIIQSTNITESLIQCSAICARDYISLYYDPSKQKCHCNSDVDKHSGNDVTKMEIFYGVYTPKEIPVLQDCKALHDDGYRKDGVYTISPRADLTSKVWCDMSSGGWTVFQYRFNGEVDFFQNWAAYKYGFGDPHGEYWLGLEMIHVLSLQASQGCIRLYTFDDMEPNISVSFYNDFYVANEADSYRIRAQAYHGSCNDPLESSFSIFSHLDMQFSTCDNDNDNEFFGRNCALDSKGGWWYNGCSESNLNGVYNKGGADGMHSTSCWHRVFPLKSTLMMIRRHY